MNAKNDWSDRQTPPEWAALKGHTEITELLIAAGADVNAKNDIGNTLLHHAAIGGNKKVAELLITEGADVNAKNRNGDTPLDVVNHLDVNTRKRGELEKKAAKKETADLLRKHGGKTGEELKAGGK